MTKPSIIRFKFISSDDPCYEEVQALRHDILRKPIGLSFTVDDEAYDKQHSQLAGFRDDHLCATCMLVSINNQTLQIKRVAVGLDHQNLGIGQEMMKYCEKYAEENNYRELLVHARETAIKFYLKLGYHIEGEMFIETTIPHVKMRKKIS